MYIDCLKSNQDLKKKTSTYINTPTVLLISESDNRKIFELLLYFASLICAWPNEFSHRSVFVVAYLK